MIILEIVEKLTEENTYFSAYIAGLSTRDRSRRCLLNVQTQVCAASGSKRGEVHEHIFLLYFFTTRRDGPVWKSQGLSSVPGRSRCSPKCRHWTSCERWDSFWVSGELCYQVLPPHPTPTRLRFPTTIPDVSPVPVVWVLDWYRQAGSHFFICFWHLVLKPGGWEGLCLSPIPCLSLCLSLLVCPGLD